MAKRPKQPAEKSSEPSLLETGKTLMSDSSAELDATLAATTSVAMEQTLASDDASATFKSIAIDSTIASTDTTTADATRPSTAQGVRQALKKGDELGRYVVLELLGVGGMGEVYSAFDPELDRKVALKVIRPVTESGRLETTARSRLVAEAQSLARLSHPNVVSIYDVGTVNGDVYIAMEFIQGETLGAWLQGAAPTWRQIVSVFIDIARGLHAAHETGLVHRDVKPDNVLIGADQRVRIIDFGVAHGGKHDEEQGGLVGTPAYMAPEQFIGGAVDSRTDQFSFAIALYFALTGQLPFAGDSVVTLANSVREGEVRPIPKDIDVPLWLVEVLDTMLSVEPEARFPSMAEVIEALAHEPPKKRWPIALALGIALVGCAGAAVALISNKDEPCAGIATAAGKVWGAAQREKLAQALAPETVALVAETVDRYTASWIAGRTASCRAFSVDKRISREIYDRRTACLDGRLRDLDAVLAVLAAGDTEENAVESVSSLPGLSVCENDSALLGKGAPPAELSEDATLALEDALRKAQALRYAGKYEPALKQTDDVVAGAKAANWLALQARALAERGQIELLLTRPKEARESLFEAVRTGSQANDVESQAVAWTYLVMVEAVGLRDAAEAQRWAKHAAVAVEKFGGDQELKGVVALQTANALRLLDRDEDAVAKYREAQALFEHALGKDHDRVAMTRGLLAMGLRRIGKLEEGERELDAALAIREKILGLKHPSLAAMLNNLSIIKKRLHKIPEARSLLERAIEIKRETLGADNASLAPSLLNLGILEADAGNADRALELWTQAYDLRRNALGDNHPDVTRTLNWRALFEHNRSNNEEALVWAKQVAAREKARLGEDAAPYGSALSLICEIQRRSGNLREAQKACDEAQSVLVGAESESRGVYVLCYSLLVAMDRRATSTVEDLAKKLEVLWLQEKEKREELVVTYEFTQARLTHFRGDVELGVKQGEQVLEKARKLGAGYSGDVAMIESWLNSVRP